MHQNMKFGRGTYEVTGVTLTVDVYAIKVAQSALAIAGRDALSRESVTVRARKQLSAIHARLLRSAGVADAKPARATMAKKLFMIRMTVS